MLISAQAIEVDPKTVEAWKRRGQARAAIGETAEVRHCYQHTLLFMHESTIASKQVMQFCFKVLWILLQALEDLSEAIKLEPTSDLLHERGIFLMCSFYLNVCAGGIRKVGSLVIVTSVILQVW